jgi:hypothetical protein
MKTQAARKKKSAMLANFEQLQRKLVPLWEHIGRSDPGSQEMEAENTVVVVPSLTTDIKLDVASQQAYEERFLFMLFLLRQPHIRLIYVTSLAVAPEIVDYYLHVLPSVTITNARKRLFLVTPQDASQQPLVNKLLERPALINQIRSLIPDLDHAHLVPYTTTDFERELAVRLGIPMYAADPRFFAFGTKSGCRQIFAEEGVSHPLGAENIFGVAELVKAIVRMRSVKPSIEKVIVKHNEGVSGYGNAQLDLGGLPIPGSSAEQDAITNRLQELRLELADVSVDWYLERLEKHGGIVEELISGEALVSPSAQLRITPLGELELLSTHDQMLGGPSGQIYLGAKFPANPAYGPMIMGEAEKIGRRFAKEGIVGRFAIDFIVVRSQSGAWQPYAIEVNLRKGGTTHPFLTLQYLTDGKYDAQSGVFRTSRGQVKHYVASDNVKSPAYHALNPNDLLDLVSEARLHFDHTSQTGVVMHMLSGIASIGKVGVTAIGDTPEQAETIYQHFIEVLDQAASRRLRE